MTHCYVKLIYYAMCIFQFNSTQLNSTQLNSTQLNSVAQNLNTSKSYPLLQRLDKRREMTPSDFLSTFGHHFFLNCLHLHFNLITWFISELGHRVGVRWCETHSVFAMCPHFARNSKIKLNPTTKSEHVIVLLHIIIVYQASV